MLTYIFYIVLPIVLPIVLTLAPAPAPPPPWCPQAKTRLEWWVGGGTLGGLREEACGQEG